MPLFVCSKCQAIENSALGKYWAEKVKLCSECGYGKWHRRFPKEKFDPKKYEYDRENLGDFIKEIK